MCQKGCGLFFILFSETTWPIEPNLVKKKIKNRPHPFYTFGFLLCTSDQQQNIKTFKGPSNDHSYQVWATGFREED
jgi:hypothetical protein